MQTTKGQISQHPHAGLPQRSPGDRAWLAASVVSAAILLGGVGWWTWGAFADRAGGPAVGEKIEMAPGPAAGGNRIGGGLRDLLGGGNRANRPAAGTTRPAATRPAANRPAATRPNR